MSRPALVRALAGVGAALTGGLAVPWLFLAIIASTPCGIEGSGILDGSEQCRVEALHVISVVVGVAGIALIAAAVGAGAAYAVTAARRWGVRFGIAWAGLLGLALLWLALAATLEVTAGST